MSEVDFLARERDFVAVDKAPGDLVIPDRFRKEGPTLFDRAKAALGEDLLLVHRLDRDTSGVLLFARSKEAQRALSTAFEAGTVHKVYLALVGGVPAADSGRIDAPLAQGRKGRIVIRESGKAAVTHWQVLERFPAHAWLEARPETGRTHQIRVHLQSIGFPIVADPRYNFTTPRPSPPAAPRLALHAHSIRFTLGDRDFRVDAPVPHDIEAALKRLREDRAARGKG